MKGVGCGRERAWWAAVGATRRRVHEKSKSKRDTAEATRAVNRVRHRSGEWEGPGEGAWGGKRGRDGLGGVEQCGAGITQHRAAADPVAGPLVGVAGVRDGLDQRGGGLAMAARMGWDGLGWVVG